MNDNKKRNRKKLTALLLFIAVFGALIYFGYNNFVKEKSVTLAKDSTGLNSKLPNENPVKPRNKLELYLQAEKDSIARMQERENDPNTKSLVNAGAREGIETSSSTIKRFSLKSYQSKQTGLNPIKAVIQNRQEDEIEKRMRDLHKLINSDTKEQTINPKTVDPPAKPTKSFESAIENANIDPELLKLDGMLDKLKDIQHPSSTRASEITDIPTKPAVSHNKVSAAKLNQTIQAVVHNTQTITNGATIKLRLQTDIVVKEQTIPRGSFLFGIASLQNERLIVQLTNINASNTVIPISLSVFDIDGIEGIYVPGAIEREAAKEGTDQAISAVNFGNYNPTMSGQLTSAGISATKSLLARKVRMQRVTVKAGHHILLQNTNNE